VRAVERGKLVRDTYRASDMLKVVFEVGFECWKL
jgi:hypothetical protein